MSSETQSEALQIARGSQKPGQTKEQTRLIARGIEKGIDLYKKKQKVKSRELDKRLKRVRGSTDSKTRVETVEKIEYRQHWLPWLLLGLTWLGIGGYLLLA